MLNVLGKLKKKEEKSKEKGFSLLELSVAVGIAAIVAAVAVTATTGFVNGASTTSQNYETAASSEISNANASFEALWGEGGAPEGNNNEPDGNNEPAATTVAFSSPNTNWFFWIDFDMIMGGPGTINASDSWNFYCFYCGVGEDGADVGGLVGWEVNVNGEVFGLEITEINDGVVFNVSSGGDMSFPNYMSVTHNVTLTNGDEIQIKAPNGEYSNVWVIGSPNPQN